ncbi:CCC motif membrane protein [Flagellimonas marina]|uniref:CCC motif membrane protein n=1 Tax=Flagellimonas marina TaxID=1775168 RepID=A0ABV8PHJ0_9FLAO
MERQKLPNATLILIFGIVSIVTCCCYGILGLIFGIIAMVLANSALKLHAANPEMYDGVQNVKTGRILAIIGIVLNLLFIAYIAWIYTTFGWDTMQDPEALREALEDLFGQ